MTGQAAGQMKQPEDGAAAETSLASVNGKTITDLPGEQQPAGQMKQDHYRLKTARMPRLALVNRLHW